MKLKFIVTGDWHIDYVPSKERKAKENLNQMLDYARKNEVEALLNTGDIFHRIQPYGNTTGVKIVQKYLQEFSKTTNNIFIVKGNNAHDAENSIELLNGFRSNIFTSETNKAVVINADGKAEVLQIDFVDFQQNAKYMIQFLPYPTKANLIKGKSIDEENLSFTKLYDELMQFHGYQATKFKEKNPNAPIIALFHGNIANCTLQNGQKLIGQDLIIPPETLERTEADFIGCGHIHLMQEIKKNIWYSGNLYNSNYGELEQKGFLEVVFEDGKLESVTPHYFKTSRPMIAVEAEFKDGKFICEAEIPENAELRYRYTVLEADKKLVTKEKLQELKKSLPEDAILEARIIPSQREVRNEEINHLPTLTDETKKYAEMMDFEISDSLLEKVSQISESTNEEEKWN